MAQSIFTLGRGVLTIGNLLYSVGAFLADFNETHVYNPKWPPHARFHNGQTMTLGVMLCATSLYLAYRPTSSIAAAKDSIFLAAAVGSWYCAAGLTAITYPGKDVVGWFRPHSLTGPKELIGRIPISQSAANRNTSLRAW